MTAEQRVTFTVNDFFVSEIGMSMDESNSYVSTSGGYYTIVCRYGKKAPWNSYITSSLVFYGSGNDNAASSYYEKQRVFNRETLSDNKAYQSTRTIEWTDGDSYYTFMLNDSNNDRNISMNYGARCFVVGDKVCEIAWQLIGRDDATAKAAIDAIEKQARKLMAGNTVSYELSIMAFHPFEYQNYDSFVHRPGSVEVAVTDEDGKPVKDRKVFLVVEDLPDNDDAGDEALYFLDPADCHGPIADCIPYSKWNSFAAAKTDRAGMATFVYSGAFNYNSLDQQIAKEGSGKVRLWAIVFDRDPESFYQYEISHAIAAERIDLAFDSVCAIDEIKTRPEGGACKVKVIRAGVAPIVVSESMLPFKLKENDKIQLDADDLVGVKWLSGRGLKMWAKDDFLTPERDFVQVSMGGRDHGWYQWIGSNVAGEPGTNTFYLESTGASWVAWGAPDLPEFAFVAATTVFHFVWWLYDDYTDPVIVEPYSKILLENDNGTTTVYTVEGTAVMHNKDGSRVNVTAGHKMGVSDDGTFSPVNTFGNSELKDDQWFALDTTDGSSGGTATASPGGHTGPGGSSGFCPIGFALLPLACMFVAMRARKRKE